MDLSMILNDDGDHGGYASSPAPSPRNDGASHVPASSRWSVDEMRNAVAILSDIQGPTEQQSERNTVRPPAENKYVDDEETEDEQDDPAVRRNTAAAPVSAGFSGLDLLFQADAMIQKRTSPERRVDKTSKKTKSSSGRSRGRVEKEDVPEDNDDDLEDDKRAGGSSSPYLRSGFWTRAEEEYAAALIFYFLRGALPIAEGTTLRKYLAEQLCCNRRRVSMKLATETIADKKIPRKVGASVFVALKPAPSDADRAQVQDVLDKLRRDCFREVEAAAGRGEVAGDGDDTDDVRTPLQRAASKSKSEPVSPLVLGPKSSEVQTTPARRKASGKPSPSPKKRRGAVASSAKSSPCNIKRRRPMIIRTGFDTPEEEEFVTALVEYFTDGLLELNDDTRLVSYLCEQLDCSAKTLSMKLAPRRMGEQKFPDNIGTMVYTRKGDDDASSEIFEAEAHVFELRQNWLQARDAGENTSDAADDDETISVSSSPSLTPSRKVKSEPSYSSVTPNTKSSSNPPRSYSRSGPWSRHEEEYAAGLIDCFFRGVLDIAEGTTLRAFLTSRLNCNPMRISKKLASHTIADVKIPKKLGSATYVRRDGVSDAERRSADEHLRHLEHLSLSEQHLKEDIVIGVIGNKTTLEEEPERDHQYRHEPPQYDRYHREESDQYEQEYRSQQQHQRRRHYSESSSPVMAPAVSPQQSPFKMRRIVVDDYAHTSQEPVVAVHHRAHRSSPPSSYDHHDAMRYQRVAY